MTEGPLRKQPIRQPLALPNTPLFRGAAKVVDTLRQAGFDAFLVGGAIRDLVMGKAASDADIASSAHPKKVQRLFRKTVPVGIDFGTVMVLLDGEQYEVTTFRADGSYEDGRRPTSVSFSNHITEDLERRDLTINGLIYDPIAQEVVDYTDGLADIENKRIRTIGAPEARFGEDRLRMLRAVRFAARLQFSLDDATMASIQALAPHILEVSKERIQQELSKMLQGYPARSTRALIDTGLLQVILPHTQGHEEDLFALMQSLETPGTWTHDVAMAAMLIDAPEAEIEPLLRGLKFSKDQCKATLAILHGQAALASFPTHSIAAQKRFLRQPHIAGILAFGKAQAALGALPQESLRAAEAAQAGWPQEQLSPPKLLNGHDLQTLGYPKGRHYKDILTELETQQLEETLIDRDDALAWLAESYGHLRPDGESAQ